MSNQSADAFRVWTADIRNMLIEAGEKSAAARVDNYSFETFDAGWQASRRTALEEAAKVCDERALNFRDTLRIIACEACANAIRALSKGETE